MPSYIDNHPSDDHVCVLQGRPLEAASAGGWTEHTQEIGRLVGAGLEGAGRGQKVQVPLVGGRARVMHAHTHNEHGLYWPEEPSSWNREVIPRKPPASPSGKPSEGVVRVWDSTPTCEQ